MTKPPPLKRIQLELDEKSWAKKLNLQKWVGRKDWNTEWRFKVVDRVREIWTISGTDLADDPHSIVEAAFTYFKKDKEFVSYILDELGMDMTADGAWDPVLKTYAWVVLQRYNKELGGEADD